MVMFNVRRLVSIMPSWEDLAYEIQCTPSAISTVRGKYLNIMREYTGRNVIAYYSAFLQKKGTLKTGIDDADKNAFMQAVYGLKKDEGLDLILHTPGGNLAATESIVEYLKKMFNNDIRAFIPQIAMSAGTMMALAAKEIIMGKQSNLGPIDPQFNGLSCAGIIEEFERVWSARQKIFGLGYNLLVFAYEKIDSPTTCILKFLNCTFIDKSRTADFTLTKRLREMLKDGANFEDIIAFLSDRNIPGDEITLSNLAEEILNNPPQQGYLTISNALQWRLQYSRVLALKNTIDGVVNYEC